MKDDNTFEIEHKYDFKHDVLAIKVKRDYVYGRTIEMEEGVLLDLDDDNVPVAFEMLDVSKRFNLPKYSLRNLVCFNLGVRITLESIMVNLRLGVFVRNRELSECVDYLTSNLDNLPVLETMLVTV